MKSFVQKFKHLNTYKVLGLMSGTSEDGVDLCFANFRIENGKWFYEILEADTLSYSQDELSIIHWAYAGKGTNIQKFDLDYGKVLHSKISQFIEKHTIAPDFICSHGHTIFHQPENGITVQIGNGQFLANELGIPVMADFRSFDVSLGGQGAPLVPIGDELLFSNYDACLNLGGFSNISMNRDGERIAFDISPANLPMNLLVQSETDKHYDKNGDLARTGKVNHDLLNRLNGIEFYQQDPPKSLGQEWLQKEFMPLVPKDLSLNDQLATIIHHIQYQIFKVFDKYNIKNCLVTGGGAKNHYLMEFLTKSGNTEIIIPDDNTVDFKEALVFAFLGILKVRGEVNTLKSVTGASRDSSGGKVFLPG
ncbi:MAG: anhydro-N-acetylmuramic acid kinase [Crocinitomicaceae bacterium]|nr:anhydro-N-acetylmuramic acid kinase [Crocinitomicaceae bacterium]